MNTVDIFLIILIAAAVLAAFAICIHNKKRGKSCCGDCSRCGGCSGDDRS